MSLPLLTLAFEGMRAAASARQRRQLAVVAVAGAVGACALLSGLLLLGWSLFLGLGALMPLPLAAASAAFSLLALSALAGYLAYRRRPTPANDIADLLVQAKPLLAQAGPLVQQHPGTAVLAAAAAGSLLALLLRR